MKKYKIAVIDNPAYAPLFSGSKANNKFDLEIIRTNQIESAELLKNDKADIALLTPLSYSHIFKSSDLRILPTTLIAAKGYSELLTISFRQNLKTLDTVLFPDNSDYEQAVSKILLAERYNMYPNFVSNLQEHSEDTIDAYFSYYKQEKGDFNFDITEDWYENFEFMLPLAFWAVKSHISDTDIIELLDSMRDDLTPDIEVVEEITDSSEYEKRDGVIQWRWSDEVEKSLDETLDMLFFHHLIPDMIDIKVFGRNYESEIQDGL